MTDILQEPEGTHEPTLPKAPRKAALASLVGSVVEYYDFFIYGVAAALVFPKVFFPAGDPKLATLASFATFGVGYVARPVGAVVLGHFGDKLGRKGVLIFTLLLMGVSTFGVGLLPTYKAVGYWAPFLLVVLRLLQGFSAGGEQSGATAMTLEHAPARQRAYFTSWTLIGTQIGSIVATSVYIPFSELPDHIFFSWGWRIPFFFSAIVVAVGFWVRRSMPETPAFEEEKNEHEIPALPIVTLFRKNGFDVARVACMALVSTVSTIVSVYALSFAITNEHRTRIPMLFVAVAANVVAIAALPACGKLADRIGRKPVFITGTVLCIPTIFIYFRAIETGSYLWITLAAILLSGLVYSASNAVWPSLYAEQFGTKVRYSGMAIGTQIGFGLAGFAPTYAKDIEHSGEGGWVPVAIMVSVVCLISAGAALFARETFDLHLYDLGKTNKELALSGVARTTASSV